MEAIVKQVPSFPMLELRLAAGESVLAEAGSMVARDGEVTMHVALDAGRDRGLRARLRGLMIAMLRRLVGGEHFFVNRFAAPAAGGWVWIAPAFAGELAPIPIREGERWTLVPGAFVAGSEGVFLHARWAGLGAILSRDAAFWVDVETATAPVWVAAQGATITLEVDGTTVVDAGHLVGFSASLRARVRGQGGKSVWATRGEGTLVELTGRGRALVQSPQHARALVGFLDPLLPD